MVRWFRALRCSYTHTKVYAGITHDQKRRWHSALPLQELEGLHPNLLRHLLQALEGEVAFTAFHAAHVGAVDAKNVCEGFLAQTSLQPVGTQIPAHRLLEITNSHISQPGHLLLEGLQTDE